MDHRPVHLHSMLVHAVIALAPLAAASFALEVRALTVGSIGPQTWGFLLRGSLIGILVLAVPATVSGITERNHLYTNWPRSHRAKLVLSVLLTIMVAVLVTHALVGVSVAELATEEEAGVVAAVWQFPQPWLPAY